LTVSIDRLADRPVAPFKDSMLPDIDTFENVLIALREARTLEDVTQRALIETVRALQAPHAELLLVSRDESSLVSLAALGLFETVAARPVPRGQGLVWASLEMDEVIVSEDASYDPRTAGLSAHGPDSPGLALLTAPMRDAHGYPLGVMSIGRTEGFNEFETRLVRLVAGLTASAIERVRLNESLARRARSDNDLLELSRLSESGESDTLERALEHLRQIAGADVAAIGPLEGRSFQLRAHAGEVGPAMLEAMRRGVTASRPILRRLTDGETLEVADTASNPALVELARAGVSSVLLSLVRVAEAPVALALFRTEVPDEFGATSNHSGRARREVGWDNDQRRTIETGIHALGALLGNLEQTRHFEAAYEGALRTLGVAVETRDREPQGHTDRLVNLAQRTGEALGLGPGDLRDLRWGAYLHDLGKLEIDERILRKLDALEPEDWLALRSHADLGFRLTANLPFLPDRVRAVVRSHHERCNGGGYPDRLRGEEIPLFARIVAACDTFEALTTDKPYRRGVTHARALEELRGAVASGQLDARVVEALETVVKG
jgi:HD-GYP domain-containing protein (c-di-GMP phosphodiesterase class II)